MTEIRIREVSKELEKQFERLQQFFNDKTVTGTIEKMIPEFWQDIQLIKDLKAENAKLKNAIQVYVNKENDSKNVMQEIINIGNQVSRWGSFLTKDGKKLIIKFGTKKKSSSGRSARKKVKKVPTKKK